jgi:cyanophycin synthetase
LSVPAAIIAEGLRSFCNSMEDSPGRFTFIDGLPVTLLFDYAHNPSALTNAVGTAQQVARGNKRICIYTNVGNRSERHFAECARVLAGSFDEYIFFEKSVWRRGRERHEINEHLRGGLIAAGVPASRIQIADGATEAATALRRVVSEGDFVMALGTDIREQLSEFAAACRLAHSEAADSPLRYPTALRQ